MLCDEIRQKVFDDKLNRFNTITNCERQTDGQTLCHRKFDDKLNRFNTITNCERQTDGQTLCHRKFGA